MHSSLLCLLGKNLFQPHYFNIFFQSSKEFLHLVFGIAFKEASIFPSMTSIDLNDVQEVVIENQKLVKSHKDLYYTNMVLAERHYLSFNKILTGRKNHDMNGRFL